MTDKKIRIVALGRCGTKSVQMFLRANGIFYTHEKYWIDEVPEYNDIGYSQFFVDWWGEDVLYLHRSSDKHNWAWSLCENEKIQQERAGHRRFEYPDVYGAMHWLDTENKRCFMRGSEAKIFNCVDISDDNWQGKVADIFGIEKPKFGKFHYHRKKDVL